METMAAQRRLIAWVLGSLALVMATFFIQRWRPLFGGSGFGLFVELASLVAAVAIGVVVTITSVGYLLGRRIGLQNRAVVVVLGSVAAIGIVLDLIAFGVASFRN